MCKRRNPTDPLVREFLEEYSINLLPLPREGARPGELYVKTGRKVKAAPGWIDELIEPALALPDPYPEDLPELSGFVSNSVSTDFGLSLLGSFLSALGVPPGIINKVKIGYKDSHAEQVSFQFSDVTRSSIDPFTIGSALINHRFKKHPWVRKGNRYYVAAAFMFSPAIVVHAQESATDGLEAEVGVATLFDVGGDVSAKRTGKTGITYSGKSPLAIGVELYDLEYDTDGQTFLMGAQKEPVALMRGRQGELKAAFPADDDEALLAIEDGDESERL